MIKKPDSNRTRKKRHRRLRKKIFGTEQRPRLNVYRSSNNIYAQIINDEKGHTLVAASTLEDEFKGKNTGNKQAAREVGLLIAKKALESGIKQVVFDRGGYLFHGRVKELADGAREGGLDL